MMIFNVAEEVDGKAYFFNMAEMYGLKEVIGTDDIVDVNLVHMQEIKPDQFRLKSTQKTRLFKNLGRWRKVMLNERNPNDKTPIPSIEHDLAVEQRKERKEMVVSAKEEQRNQPEGSHFRIRVPLSEYNIYGVPLLAMNRRKQFMNESVSIVFSYSICIARV